MEELYTKLTEIFRDTFDDETLILKDELCADNIEGWDSLAHITLLAAIQDEFHIELDMDEIEKLSNVGEMIACIKEKVYGNE